MSVFPVVLSFCPSSSSMWWWASLTVEQKITDQAHPEQVEEHA